MFTHLTANIGYKCIIRLRRCIVSRGSCPTQHETPSTQKQYSSQHDEETTEQKGASHKQCDLRLVELNRFLSFWTAKSTVNL